MSTITRYSLKNELLCASRSLSLYTKLNEHRKLLRRKESIRKRWEAIGDEDKKSFPEVLDDVKQLIYKYNQRLRYIFPDYWNERIYLKDVSVDKRVVWNEWDQWRKILDCLDEETFDIFYSKERLSQALSKCGIPCPRNIGTLAWDKERKGAYLSKDGKQTSLDEVIDTYGGIFCKPDDACQGSGCMKIQKSDTGQLLINYEPSSPEKLAEIIKEEAFAAEILLAQHEDLAIFHPSSINTCRIVTMKAPGGDVVFHGSLLKIGTGGKSIDNLENGGIGVKIYRDGSLHEHAIYIDSTKAPLAEHPDTHVAFKGRNIPQFAEAIELAKKAHLTIAPRTFIIGWDVAITPAGPLIIEGNVHCAIYQPWFGDLRPVFEQYLKPMAQAALDGNLPAFHQEIK